MLHFLIIHWDKRRADIDAAWLSARFKFFRDNTLKSLRSQTNKNFQLWHCCGANMRDDVAELRAITPEAYFTFLSTTPQTGEHLTNVLTPADRQQLANSETVRITRIDSDDLYSNDALALAAACKPRDPTRIEASMFCRGYMFDPRSGRVGVHVSSSTPFHTLMVPAKLFADEEAYNRVPIGDHSIVSKSWHTQVLEPWKFCVLIHGNNFLSDFNYKNLIEPYEINWSAARWARQPVVFDCDDFSDEWNCLPALDRLWEAYPEFSATLFAIPARCSDKLLQQVKARPWLELAVHGRTHVPNEELKTLTPDDLEAHLSSMDWGTWAKGFRPPGWYITRDHVDVLSDHGCWVAVHLRDLQTLGRRCRSGFYVCNEKPHCHTHSHNVCNNSIDQLLPELLTKWPKDQAFAKVSEAVMTYGNRTA